VQHRRRITAAEDRKVVIRTAEAFRLGSRQRGGKQEEERKSVVVEQEEEEEEW
jgi:hypothetical protein